MYALDVVGGVLLSGINWLLIAEEIGVVARVGEPQKDSKLSKLERQLGAHDVHWRPRLVGHRRSLPQGRRSAGYSLARNGRSDRVRLDLTPNLRESFFEGLDLLVHGSPVEVRERPSPPPSVLQVKRQA